jgi:SAM-dependent methyltransferase
MTKVTRSPAALVYGRVAGVYDSYTAPMEALGSRTARRRLFGRSRGRVLEIGIGTGLNLASYPAEVELTGIDTSPRMLDRARRRAAQMGDSREPVGGRHRSAADPERQLRHSHRLLRLLLLTEFVDVPDAMNYQPLLAVPNSV